MTGKQYLGDGVYLDEDDSGWLVLTTENGIEATNTIYLNLDVAKALLTKLHEIINPLT
jgi:hypothetical protein